MPVRSGRRLWCWVPISPYAGRKILGLERKSKEEKKEGTGESCANVIAASGFDARKSPLGSSLNPYDNPPIVGLRTQECPKAQRPSVDGIDHRHPFPSADCGDRSPVNACCCASLVDPVLVGYLRFPPRTAARASLAPSRSAFQSRHLTQNRAPDPLFFVKGRLSCDPDRFPPPVPVVVFLLPLCFVLFLSSFAATVGL